MPKYAIDYSRTCMYKICCKDPSIKDEYYGHTTDKTKRKQNHKTRCNNPDVKQYNFYVYQFIRENGGWDNWSMIIVEEYPCENRNQAELRERYWIEKQQSTLNQVIPTRTRQEYYEENREELCEKSKHYYEEHKEEILEQNKQYKEEHKEQIIEKNKQYREEHKEQRNQKFECECGGNYINNNKSRHMKTQKHLKHLEELNKL